MSRLAALGALPRRPLLPLTSLKVGGPADWLLRTSEREHAIAALQMAVDEGLPVTFLGGGSNLLVSDAGVEGLVLKPMFARVQMLVDRDQAVLYAEAGQSFSALARRLAHQGWAGLEWAVSVPGTIGGAVVNNAGAFGGACQDVLLSVDVVDAEGRLRELDPAALAYRYRYSRLKERELGLLLVVGARFALRRADPHLLRQTVQRLQDQRTLTQPRQQSAGSVFTNPEGDYAGRLVEAAGLKGATIGKAQVSPQHANFIVTFPGATAADVYALIVLMQEEVWRQHRVWLRPEIQLVGRWSEAERRRLEAPLA